MDIRALNPMFHGQVGTSWKVVFVTPVDPLTYVLQDLVLAVAPGVLTLAEVDLVTGALVGDAYAGSPTTAEKVIVISGTDSVSKMNYPVDQGKMLVARSSSGNATLFLQGVVAR